MLRKLILCNRTLIKANGTSIGAGKQITPIDCVIASALLSVKLLVEHKLSLMSLREKLFFASSFKSFGLSFSLRDFFKCLQDCQIQLS
jgi:hypothetical protein